MHWYGGSMVEAVNLSKQRNAIFVVFIEGENDLSVELAATIESQAVVSKLSDETNFLAVKLKSGSENYIHFAKIYQIVPVPSLFFIGRNGTPLEVVCAGVEAQNLAERIDRILDQHYKDKSLQPSTSGQNIRQQTASLLQAESAPNPLVQPSRAPAAPGVSPSPRPEKQPTSETPPPAQAVETSNGKEVKPSTPVEPDASEPPSKVPRTEASDDVTGATGADVTSSSPGPGLGYDVVCDGEVCVRRPRGRPTEPGPSQASADVAPAGTDDSMEEKLEHAKEVIEARRREKADKEKELEKEREKERRATGQGVAELKRWQADQEMKQLQEERKREKLENEQARRRILAQIAQDRAERRARDQPSPPQAQASAPPAQAAAPPAATSGDAASGARVQFKLPDGSAHTAHFDANASLDRVREYVADNLQMSPSSFSLWTAFPRRELADGAATLLQLQLAPSAALLVLSRRPPPPPVATRSVVEIISQLLTTILLEPSYALYRWIRDRLFPAGPPASAPAPPTPAPTPPPTQPSAGLRRRGNVHRLTGDRVADDDNNTWNGNSTQQM